MQIRTFIPYLVLLILTPIVFIALIPTRTADAALNVSSPNLVALQKAATIACSGDSPSNPRTQACADAVAAYSAAIKSKNDAVTNLLTTSSDPNATPEAKQAAEDAAASALGGTRQPLPAVGPCYQVWIFSSWRCVWHSIVASISSILISITAWLLAVSGVLFNWIVYNTIVLFKTSLFDKIDPAITTGWTAFRDIANILIIGIFTFIAISIILGLKEFGQKKLIAHVLIIAVMINFSLLFTKMIVDASNFTALQIFNAAQLQGPSSGTVSTGCSGTGVDPSCGFAQTGIAGQFVGLMGVNGITDTYTAMLNLADNQDSGWIALVHGLFTATLFIAAALVLLYGSFLLVSRAVLIIFLMLTAAIAFASYLIPKWSSSRYGWDAWWSSLIKSAAFAPIVLMFLWITLRVGSAIQSKTGSLGDLVAHPDKAVDISALFSYIIILGMLFVSFKLSSVFAGKIAGFDMFATGLRLGATPFTLASRFAVAPIGRQLFGRWAAGREETSIAEAKEARLQAKRARDLGDLAGARRFDKAAAIGARSAGRYGRIASGSMNVMDTGLAKTIADATGMKGLMSGQSPKGTKGYSGAIDERVKDASKLAEKLAPSTDEIRKETAREEQRFKETREIGKKSLQQQRQFAEEQIETQRKGIEEEHKVAQTAVQTAKETAARIDAGHETTIKGIRDELAKAATPDETIRHQGRLQAAESQRASDMRQQARNIEIAQQTATEKSAQLQGLHDVKVEITDSEGNKIKTSVNEASDKLKDYDNETDREMKKIADKVRDSFAKSMAETAVEVGKRSDPIWDRIVGGITGDNDRVAKGVKKKYTSKRSNRAKLAEALKDESEPEPKEAEH